MHPTNSILRMNSNQVDFSTFCIGSVATALNMNQAEVYRRLKSSGILMDYIVGCYDVLHTFGRLYLVEDITSLMRTLSAGHRCLPDLPENRKTEIAMEANETLLQMKYARIIEQIAADLGISNVDAMDLFYNSRTFQLISQGIADLHCRSDRYLAEEVERENVSL